MKFSEFITEATKEQKINRNKIKVGMKVTVKSDIKMDKDLEEYKGKNGKIIEYPLHPMFGGSKEKGWCLVQIGGMKVEMPTRYLNY